MSAPSLPDSDGDGGGGAGAAAGDGATPGTPQELVPPPKQHEYARAIILGGELNVHDPRNGTTWLHECAKQGWDTTANMLLTHGANANLEDDLGRTALCVAREAGHKKLVWLLKPVTDNASDVDSD